MGLEQVASVVISLISPVAVAAVTAFLTSRNARENEMRKLLHEKRLELYMSFYEQVERCLKNRQIVFEQEYFQKIGTYKAKMTLMASENTRKAFDEFFRFLYKGIIIKHNKTEPTYTKTSLFLCEKRRFFMARTEKGVVTTI